MANRLKMAMVHTIYTLLQQGWSRRRIAQALGIDRETVGRYARLTSTPAPVPLGSEGAPAPPKVEGPSKPARAPPGSAFDFTSIYDTPEALKTSHSEAPRVASVQSSACEPFRAIILAKLEQGLSAQRIYQDLRIEHGFTRQYHSVRRFVQCLRGRRPLPFRRMECAPGAEAQIDFGTGAPVVIPDDPDRPADRPCRRKTHVFRIVLGYSRKAYSETVFRQTAEEFIRCMENAFRHFGGVPRTLVVDNLKAAVTQPDWYDPELNPKIQAFCEHYGTAMLPTKSYTPRHKGKTERGIGYVQDNALKGRSFTSLEEENEFLLHWETTVADTRIHGTTRRQVDKVFEEIERAALLPLPIDRFPFFHEAQRRVHRDGHVEVDKAYYSVPPEYLGRTVWVRWDGHVVRIFNERLEQITIHAPREAGRFSTHSQHIAAEKIAGVERGTAYLLRKVGRIGPHSARWAQSMLTERGIPGVRVLVGLMALANRYDDEQIEQACEIAQTHGAYRLRVIRELIKRRAPKQEQFEFIQQHPIIRGLDEYGDLVRHALRRTPASPAFPGEEPAPQVLPQTPSPWASFPSPIITGDLT
jgi:transposase